MSNINLGTLQKIQYTNLTEFVDGINRNFAVVQNSPLFKGIPGNEGEEGPGGLSGERGSKFFFLEFVKFNLQFPTEVTLGSHIDIVFLNSKLSNPTEKTKILSAIESPNLVDKDVFVLTNSKLVSYNYSENKFYDTGRSLNTSITQEIQEIINNLFQSYLPQLQSGIKNVFENYSTLAKNYSDNNNTGISTEINSTSVYSPFIQGITSNIGIAVPNHKYYGISQTLNNETSENTAVFGSIVKYYKLLMNTLNTDGSQTLTSNYAPGNNNIPAAIFMQDTLNAGLLFGFKDKTNLKSFGSIFKNDSDELEIKSDSGKLVSDFSSLKIHKNYLRYNKLVEFNDSLKLSNNIFVGGHVNQSNIKTGTYAYQENKALFDALYTSAEINQKYITAVLPPDTTPIINNPGTSTGGIDSGIDGKVVGDKDGASGGIIKNTTTNTFYINNANNIFLRATNYKGKVLVTNAQGLVSSSYTLENRVFADYNATTYIPPAEIVTGTATNKILSTYYYNYLVRKINLLYNTQVNGLYWTKSEFETNVIPNLKLNNNLNVDKISNFGNVAEFNGTSNTSTFRGNQLIVHTPSLIFTQAKNKVLVMGINGIARYDVIVDYNNFSISSGGIGGVEVIGGLAGKGVGTDSGGTTSSAVGGGTTTTGFTKLSLTSGMFELITKYHYNKIIDYLNSLNTDLSGNYWTKPDFTSFTIPNLALNNGLFARKHFAVSANVTNDEFDGEYMNSPNVHFYTSSDTGETMMSGEQTYLFSDVTKIKGFGANQLLGTLPSNSTFNGDPTAIILPINMIGPLASITSQTYNNLNNQSTRTIADNKTIASLLLGVITNYDNLKAYIDSQISILNQQLTNQINNLATDVYSKIQVINNNITNIQNTLATKADISWVDTNFQTIYSNFANINNTLVSQQNQINALTAALNTKVDKSVFEPWKAIVDEFMLNNVQFPKGGIILWEGKIINGILQAAIPTNFEEVTSMRGRVAVGWTNGNNTINFMASDFTYPFNTLGKEDGKASHTLVIGELPSHQFSIFGGDGINSPLIKNNPNGTAAAYFDSPSDSGDWNGGITTAAGTAYAGKTNSLGNNYAHNILQPYKVLIYIRATKGA